MNTLVVEAGISSSSGLTLQSMRPSIVPMATPHCPPRPIGGPPVPVVQLRPLRVAQILGHELGRTSMADQTGSHQRLGKTTDHDTLGFGKG